jgi:tRNA1(Val) A37 N6-methylase TrmN6
VSTGEDVAFPAEGLRCWQPTGGYRFGTEVVLLADFALRGGSVARAVDLGTGSGILALLLAFCGLEVLAVERERRWAPLLTRSLEESVTPGAVRLHWEDARTLDPASVGAPFDVAVCNPPYFPAAFSRSPDPWKASARSLLHGDGLELAAAALRLAPRACLVTRPDRARELLAAGFGATRIARHGDRLVLLELVPFTSTPREEPCDLAAAYARFGRSPKRGEEVRTLPDEAPRNRGTV